MPKSKIEFQSSKIAEREIGGLKVVPIGQTKVLLLNDTNHPVCFPTPGVPRASSRTISDDRGPSLLRSWLLIGCVLSLSLDDGK